MRIVASAVIFCNGRLLLCRRGPGIFPYAWEFPSVEIQNDETVEDALEEFLFMELGATVRVKGRLFSFQMEFYGDLCVFYAYSVEITGGSLALEMYTDAGLFAFKPLEKWNLSPYSRRLSRCLCDFNHELLQKEQIVNN